MTPEKFEEMRQSAKELADKVAKECDEHAKQVLSWEEFEMYHGLLSDFTSDLVMMHMMGKGPVFYEALAALNKIVANAQAGEIAWKQSNPQEP